MSTLNNPRPDRPNTYFVQDRSSEEELTRLLIQDQMFTSRMGGVLPEQPDSTSLRRVLDVACGTGCWLMETARAYPTISTLVGVDISVRMIGYANTLAQQQQLGDRVEFHVMDALLILEFPEAYFDLTNLRFSSSFQRTWEWPKMLDELCRVTRRGGTIRITESSFPQSNSPALTQLFELATNAGYRAGHFFHPASDSVLNELPHLLRQHGLQRLQTRSHVLVYRADAPGWQSFYEDMVHLFRTIVPFCRRWTRVPDNYEEIYQQSLREMLQPDFAATWTLLTAWGESPSRQRPVDVILD